MKTNNFSLTKTAFKESKKRFVIISLPLSFFALITIGVLVLGFFAPFTLLLTVPFIVIPSFFSIAAINCIALNKNTHEGLGFFIMFRAYFSSFFRGGYKVILGLLKFLLALLISSLIISIILVNTILVKDPGYVEFINQMNTITDPNALVDLMNNFFETNQAFQEVIYLGYILSFFVAFIVFLHHFSVNHFKYNYNFEAKMPLPIQDLNLISKEVIRANRKDFYKSYYNLNWFLLVIAIIGYLAGSLLSFFFVKNIDMTQAAIVGLFGAFILLLLFIPYYLCGSELQFSGFKKDFLNKLIELSMKSLEEMKKARNISEEKEQEVIKFLNDQKELEEKDDKNNNENK